MSRHRLPLVYLFLVLAVSSLQAGELVPFRATWEGSTVSATLVAPGVVLVVSDGEGQATHLGRYFMSSPHFTYLATGVVEGEQNFTAANGDVLNATFSGQLLPRADGCLEGTLPATITGGTGRFDGATGSYDFHIVACPGPTGYDSVATIEGWISSPGNN
jgi:hypothetical protein